MRTRTLKLDAIRYNPEWQAFEALVEIEEAGALWAYPVHFPAPLTSDPARIVKGLVARAEAAHRTGRAPLRLCRATRKRPHLRGGTDALAA